jgi:hypothetical protein
MAGHWRNCVPCGAPLVTRSKSCLSCRQRCTIKTGKQARSAPGGVVGVCVCGAEIVEWCETKALIGKRCDEHAGAEPHPDVPAWALTEPNRWYQMRTPSAARAYEESADPTHRSNVAVRATFARLMSRLEEEPDAVEASALMRRVLDAEATAAAALQRRAQAVATAREAEAEAAAPSAFVVQRVLHTGPVMLPAKKEEKT